MKKQLLVFATAMLCLGAAQAQDCTPGVSSNGFSDDFSTSTDPGDENGGVYWWGDSLLAGDEFPNFQAARSRDSVNQELNVTITQGAGEYIPFGISFGDVNDTIVTTDLSGNASFSFVVENTSATAVKMAFSLEDIDGNLLNTKSTAPDFASAWQHEMSLVLEPGQSQVFSGDFAGAFYANYDNSQLETTFDYTQVKGVAFTVTSTENTGAPNYEPLAIADIGLVMKEFVVGQCEALGFWENKLSSGFDVFPTPSNGELYVSFENADFTNVSAFVMNTRGEQVYQGLQLKSGDALDLKNLPEGVYSIQLIDARTGAYQVESFVLAK